MCLRNALAILTISLLTQISFALEASPRSLVHLLDYLAQDYGGAVQVGKVISKEEYDEQVEFADSALKIATELNKGDLSKEVLPQIKKLSGLINSKAQAKLVSQLALAIKADVIRFAKLDTAPLRWPEVARGEMLFKNNCVTCHGQEGRGDGPAGEALNPRPTNFHDGERLSQISPFQAFNTIRLGVEGTGMVPFATYSDEDTWALAFYVVSLRHRALAETDEKKIQVILDQTLPEITLEEAASSSDALLTTKLSKIKDLPVEKALALTRLFTFGEGGQAFISIAIRSLREASALYQQGSVTEARQKALVAYLEGVEPIEPRLKAVDNDLKIEVEAKMAAVRGSIESAKSPAEVDAQVQEALATLKTVTRKLHSEPPSPIVTMIAAASIILREGFEAVLIIIALLGVVRVAQARKAERYIHGGWIVATVIGVFGWIFSGWLLKMSGAQREFLEGITALIAVVILLYMGFWLHSRTEINRWKAFIEGQVTTALKEGNLLGLAFISFLSVFREAFETVLFLRAIWLQSETGSKTAMVGGVAAAFVLLFILAYAMIRFSAKIPIRKLFSISSFLMLVLAIALVGQGVHALQETGMISVTPVFSWLDLELLGVYPTGETLFSQATVILISFMLWLVSKRPELNRQAYNN